MSLDPGPSPQEKVNGSMVVSIDHTNTDAFLAFKRAEDGKPLPTIPRPQGGPPCPVFSTRHRRKHGEVPLMSAKNPNQKTTRSVEKTYALI